MSNKKNPDNYNFKVDILERIIYSSLSIFAIIYITSNPKKDSFEKLPDKDLNQKQEQQFDKRAYFARTQIQSLRNQSK
jgi:hypothetical protein